METLNIHNIANLTRYAVSCGVVEANCPPYWQVPRPFVHQAGIRGSALAGWRQTNTHQNEGMFGMGSPGRNGAKEGEQDGGLGRLAADRKAVLIAWNQPSASYSPPVTIKQRKYGQQNRAEGARPEDYGREELPNNISVGERKITIMKNKNRSNKRSPIGGSLCH